MICIMPSTQPKESSFQGMCAAATEERFVFPPKRQQQQQQLPQTRRFSMPDASRPERTWLVVVTMLHDGGVFQQQWEMMW
jgi:hypothetical protein